MDIDNIVGPLSHPSPPPPRRAANSMTEPPNYHSAIPDSIPVSPRTLQPTPQVDACGSRELPGMGAFVEPSRKLRKEATGYSPNSVNSMTLINTPTHYIPPPKPFTHKGSSLTPQKRGSITSDIDSYPLQAQTPSLLPQHNQLYEGDSDDRMVRGGSVESDDQQYLITAEDGSIVPAADSPEARKRRLNTIAARRSRQRKLEYVRSLEAQVAELQKERDELRARCRRGEEKVQWLKEMLMDGRGAGSS
ncbi:uncharacterized protein EI90DRAFT_3020335 [Cantharellus anzutake]|uniref:uncharacterized protein n=1 Tax=Cantharellus anzutake TaxID=1750568 RepID=UPI001904C296|nr:uncharacterized protein EI90DRAFT_3020335 [Cantharellus anzutake]KAF8321069.1 hypothetical protein EI90DRAFT_3020335 [Cantharellus anzutake]